MTIIKVNINQTVGSALNMATVILLCLILTLYLSPTKEPVADILVSILLVLAVGVSRTELIACVRPLAPLITMFFYVFGSDLITESSGEFLKLMLMGCLPYFLFYMMAARQLSNKVLVALFLVPGLIHLGYLCLDMIMAIWHGDVSFASSSRQGALEQLKDTTRVGRRYASLAMLHFLAGGLLLGSLFKEKIADKKWAWVVCGLSVLSLALLDARGAYVSLFVGCMLLLLTAGPKRSILEIWSLLPVSTIGRLLAVGFFVVALGIGYSTGKSRWQSMSYSLSAAAQDVFNSDVELSQRPFVSTNYWSAPIEDSRACYLQERFRCKVDQSAYLRSAWILVGMKSLLEHPLGIGYSKDYMARLWALEGQDGVYSHNDSFLIELGVSFGIPGLILYALFWYGIVHSFRAAIYRGNVSAQLTIVCGLVFVSVGRSIIDQFNEGLWRYLMALVGMYFGLLQVEKNRSECDASRA